MEEVLPQEIVSVVLLYLPEVALYRYSQCSRKCLASADRIWKKKLIDLYGGSKIFYMTLVRKESDNHILVKSPISKFVVKLTQRSFLTTYIKDNRSMIKRNLKSLYTKSIDDANTNDSKIQSIYKLIQYVIENKEVISTYKTFQKFYTSLEKRIYDLCSKTEFVKGESYYKVLFPDLYELKFNSGIEEIKNLFCNEYQ
jgi:hypothetical protein